MNILDQNIDEAVADYILAKVVEYKAELDANLNKSVSKIKAQYEAKKEALIEHADAILEEREAEIREEYSARSIAKLQEKNEQIEQLEAQFESYKDSLSEKVHTFLSNSKAEVRSLVEEEIRMDSEHLKAERTIDEIKALVGATEISTVSNVDEGKLARLSEDIEVLKERLESKTAANNKLKAKLKVFELTESVPSSDREFFISQLSDVQTVSEAEETFTRLKKATRAARVQMIEEETKSVAPQGRIDEDKTDHSPRVPSKSSSVEERMKSLAGI